MDFKICVSLQTLTSAIRQVHVDQITFVTTLLDHTYVIVHWDLLLILAHKIHWIQFVLVRNLTYVFIYIILLLSAIQLVKLLQWQAMVGVVKVTWLYPNFGHELSIKSQ